MRIGRHCPMLRRADRIDRRGEDLKSLHHDTQAPMVWLGMLSGRSLGVVFEVQIVSSCKRLVGRACPLCINRSALSAGFEDHIRPRRLRPPLSILRKVPIPFILQKLVRRAGATKANHTDCGKVGGHRPIGGDGHGIGIRKRFSPRVAWSKSHRRGSNRQRLKCGDERHARSPEDHRRPGTKLAG